MTAFWPTRDWAPWASLEAAGVRVTDDPRGVAPPIVLFEIAEETPAGSLGGCNVTDGVAKAIAIAPGSDTADSRKWCWTEVAPVLLPYSDPGRPATQSDWNGMPAVEVFIPFTFTEGD